MSDINWMLKTQDGSVYGPANITTIRKWIQENRVLADDLLLLEGEEKNWQPTKSLAQFADLFVAKAAPVEKKCPHCRAILLPEAVICTNCGTDLKTGEKIASVEIGKPDRTLQARALSTTSPINSVGASRSDRMSSENKRKTMGRQRTLRLTIACLVLGILGLIISMFIYGKSEATVGVKNTKVYVELEAKTEMTSIKEGISVSVLEERKSGIYDMLKVKFGSEQEGWLRRYVLCTANEWKRRQTTGDIPDYNRIAIIGGEKGKFFIRPGSSFGLDHNGDLYLPEGGGVWLDSTVMGMKVNILGLAIKKGNPRVILLIKQGGRQIVKLPIWFKNRTEPYTSPSNTLSDYTIPDLGMKLIYVAPGTFQMGSNDRDSDKDEKPVHRVTISKGYWIGKYEVTQSEYQSIIGTNPSHLKGNNKSVGTISWNDARKFCEKLNERERRAGRLSSGEYRLPTEAEWEYAARGGTKSRGYKYSGTDNIDTVAWFSGSRMYFASVNQTKVGTKSANELGIHDMSGNVHEWCSDWYGNYSSGSGIDPTGASSG